MGIVSEGTPTKHPLVNRNELDRVRELHVLAIVSVAVVHPLRDVAMHVVQAKVVGVLLGNFVSLEAGVR